MSKLSKPIEVETAFNNYSLREVLGEGGAGRVYGGTDATGGGVAVKVLTNQSSDKRRRFKNEIGFLLRHKHSNIVSVIDHGVCESGPFYVMARYKSSLRAMIGQLAPQDVLARFAQLLDGVEAAHLLGVTHRDLKPENVLVEESGGIAVADFGVASFTEAELHTLVNTAPAQRLANFQYAAPEQRATGAHVGAQADIYALGLMLNEMFTGSVPHGTEYRPISAASEEFAFLDPIVAKMIRQSSAERLQSIDAVKKEIQIYHAEAVSRQKLSELDKVVIPAGEVSDPLAHKPPKITDVDWNNGQLTLTLDQAVHREWVDALLNMGNYTSLMGCEPHSWGFNGKRATAHVQQHSAQQAIDYFKDWLPKATAMLKYRLEERMRRDEQEQRAQLESQRKAEQARLSVNSTLRF